MSERRITILSTASLPLEGTSKIPPSVEIHVIPFIEIVQRPSVQLMPVVSAYGTEKLNAIFTSAHAVKFVSGWLKQKPDWTIYCIRNETRNAVLKYFGTEVACKFSGNALFLSRLMISEGVRKAIFFCGDQRLDILPDNLRSNGIDLSELVVYDTRLKPVKLKEPPEIILFFSPSAVRSFFMMNEISSGTTVIAMGTTTAAALKEYTEYPVVISPEADKTYVLNMALDYATSHPIN